MVAALTGGCSSPAPVTPAPSASATSGQSAAATSSAVPTTSALPATPAVTPSLVPPGSSAVPAYLDPSVVLSARVRDLLGRMTTDEKIGQMTLIERGDLAPEDVATYHLGAVLSGGGSAPQDNTPAGWADMVDGFQSAALSTRLGIPILYGTDSVHGDGNLMNSTIFPHNIGIGATRDTQLATLIGRATAEETASTGANWTFSPCLCVSRNIRWGRTYESYSEDPTTVTDFTSVITGYQGTTLGVGPASILATAKHYLGDGGTQGGVNEGNTVLPEDQLEAIHLAPYRSAVEKGVGSVMVSFSSVNGTLMHADAHLINDVLKTELGFEGFVVSDWAGINRIDGVPADTSGTDVSTAVNAGIDMIMVPNGAAAFEQTLSAEIAAGHIPMSRIDDAVSRILGEKIQLGLFEHPLADRSLAATVGSPEHRALARRAVAELLVVLKNQGDLLPLKETASILVTGRNADDIGAQNGGWTTTWQGLRGNITQGTSILAGIRQAVGSAGTVDFDPSGASAPGHDVVIAVLGEDPYAESQGDRQDGLELNAADKQVLATLAPLGVPIAVVLVSGRPLVITQQLPEMAALAAAWLPGTEGGGVADVLFGDAPAVGTLGFSWPRSADQLPLDVGAATYDPLFPFGFSVPLRSVK